jgi:hypothetical protein
LSIALSVVVAGRIKYGPVVLAADEEEGDVVETSGADSGAGSDACAGVRSAGTLQ